MPGEFIISSILSRCSKIFEAMGGPALTSVTAQFYLANKGKYILKVWELADPKEAKRRQARGSIMALLFTCFSASPDLPWAVCFT